MIRVHRLNGKEFIVNCELIRSAESTPDTVLTLSDGDKLMVKESLDEIIAATIAYKKQFMFRTVEAD